MANIDRFIKYVQIDTQADENSETSPSTMKQKNLGRLLLEELKLLGVDDAIMDEFGIVYGHVPGVGNEKIGFNAHIDTALEVSDENVKPTIIKNYDGKDITLANGMVLSPNQFHSLKRNVGHDIVVTDGNTLLGADDKAGIAIIMSAVEFFKNHPEIKHRPISIAFTCDEEIGRGSEHFSLEKMDADYAFTLDGGCPEYIGAENFNAEKCVVNVKGVSVHPGSGKGQLVNALLVLNSFISELPEEETPFYADYDHGYWHMNNINGSSDEVTMDMILREFDENIMKKRKEAIIYAKNATLAKYPQAEINVTFKYQYENMRPYVDKNPRPLEVCKQALIKNGITPIMEKIRGGTDGAAFTKMGLVTPNLGTGGYNCHGRFEYLDIQEYEKMINVVIDILRVE